MTAALVVMALAGCASAVPVEAATDATDPDCASVVLATPDHLADGLDRRRTTAQATTAWGDPAVVLRCGVAPPGPTTTTCETVTTPNGPSVDWLVVQHDGTDGAATEPEATSTAGAAPAPGATATPAEAAATDETVAPEATAAPVGTASPVPATAWTFTTYGRVPAIEVDVPAAVAATRSTDFLDALGPAIAEHTTQQRSCL